MDDVAAGEERAAGEHFSEDAADGPDVDRLRVLREEAAAELRGPVPACGNVVRPEDRRGLVGEGGAGEAEVADLELAVAVREDILRLQVAVEDVRWED